MNQLNDMNTLTFSTPDLGLASYLFTKHKEDFLGTSKSSDRASFQFTDSLVIQHAVQDYFSDRDGFLSFRNNFNSLKVLALHNAPSS